MEQPWRTWADSFHVKRKPKPCSRNTPSTIQLLTVIQPMANSDLVHGSKPELVWTSPHPKHQLFRSTGLLWCYFTTGLWKSAITLTTPSLPFVHLFVLKAESCLSAKQQPLALASLAGPRWSSYQESVYSHLGVLWALLVSQVCLLV